MSEYLARLTTQLVGANNSARRSEIAADLAILFEQALINEVELENEIFLDAVTSLTRLLASEKDPETRISFLHALVNASSLAPWLGVKPGLDVLVKDVGSYREEEMEYVLYILGFTRDPQYLSILQQYENHQNENLRSTARDARLELTAGKLE